VPARPAATRGGVSMVLYGMISAVGVRNVVENQVDFTNSRNVIVAAIIMVLAIGVNYSGAVTFTVGTATISLSGLAVAAITGIALNAILPGKDYEFFYPLCPAPCCSGRKMKVLWKKFKKTIKSAPKSLRPPKKSVRMEPVHRKLYQSGGTYYGVFG